MTEESYLPPGDDDTGSVFFPCEPNAAQEPTKPSMVKIVGGAIIMLALALLFIGLQMRPTRGYMVAISILLFLVGGVFAFVDDRFNTQKKRQHAWAIQELYPESDMKDYMVLTIAPPQIGRDGMAHREDKGFLTVENDMLCWRGAWFQLLVQRSDIRSVVCHAEGFESHHLVVLHPDRIGTIKTLGFREMPNGKVKYVFLSNTRLRDWHTTQVAHDHGPRERT